MMKKKEEEFELVVEGRVQQGQTMTNSRDKIMTGLRTSVPFHIPTIPKPQDEFSIFVNNSNQPFEHVWLQKSEEGTRFIHPLEKLTESDLIDKNVESIEPVKPFPMDRTPFKLVEDVKELKQLASKLRSVNEFAVDLEHNQYRSFQGLTCLMQISTREEDFVVDTLKLRVHVGPYLREVFKDPSKKKVMHGADRDIVWLQRDFGIYICNLFDTQQASRVLDLERNSLEYLLIYFCGIAANKAYQNADWRLRPLPDDMLRYAREDTHYLLYIYDLMRGRLFKGSNGGNDLLLEVHRRSYDICMQLYEKELLTSTSYLYIYGLQEADFSPQQLSIVSGLCEWRDAVARAEDESTGYILPNKSLLEIARQMPLTVSKLRRLVKSKHPYVDVNLDSIVGIIKSSVRNAASFESAAQLLKNGCQETVAEQNIGVVSDVSSQQERIDYGEIVNRVKGNTTECLSASSWAKENYPKFERERIVCSKSSQGSSFQPFGEVGKIKKEQNSHTTDLPREGFTVSGQFSGATEDLPSQDGLWNSASKSKFDTNPKVMQQTTGLASTVSSQRERIDGGEGGHRVNGQTTKCLSAWGCVEGEVITEHRVADDDDDDAEGVNRVDKQTTLSASLRVNEEVVTEQNMEVACTASQRELIDDGESVIRVNGQTTLSASVRVREEYPDFERRKVEGCSSSQGSDFQASDKVKVIKKEQNSYAPDLPEESFTILGQMKGTYTDKGNSYSPKDFSGTTKQVLSNSCHDFGLETSTLKPKSETDLKGDGDTERSKLDPGVETTLSNLPIFRFWKSFHLKREKEKSSAAQLSCGSQLRAFDSSAAAAMTQIAEGDEGFKSLLNSRDGCNSSSIISRFRKDEVTKDFQQAKQYQTLLCAGSQTL